MAILKSIQSGTVTLTDGSISVTDRIFNAVNLDKSFLIFSRVHVVVRGGRKSR